MDPIFTASQVATALRRFDDYGEDVLNSVYQTYANNLEIFLNHCERDSVMSTITAPLKENVNVNLDAWYRAFLASGGSFVGSKRFTLPSDEEDRLALFYQFLLAINEDRISLTDFCSNAFGTDDFDDTVRTFNQQIFRPFIRDFRYRLESIRRTVESKGSLGSRELQIFTHIEKQINISNVDRSNIAVDHSSISTSESPELLRFFTDILASLRNSSAPKDLIEEIEKVQSAHEQMRRLDIATAIDRAVQHQPALREKIRTFVESVGASLAASGIVEALRLVLQ